MDMRIPPLTIKIMLESIPLKFVHVPAAVVQRGLLRGGEGTAD